MTSHYLDSWVNISSKREVPFLKACIVSVIVCIRAKTQFFNVFLYFFFTLFCMCILETHRLKWFLEGLLSIQVSDLCMEILTKNHKCTTKAKKSKKICLGILFMSCNLPFFFLVSYVLHYLLLIIFLCIHFHALNLSHLWLSLLKNSTSTSSCVCCLVLVKLQ